MSYFVVIQDERSIKSITQNWPGEYNAAQVSGPLARLDIYGV